MLYSSQNYFLLSDAYNAIHFFRKEEDKKCLNRISQKLFGDDSLDIKKKAHQIQLLNYAMK